MHNSYNLKFNEFNYFLLSGIFLKSMIKTIYFIN